MQLQLCDVEPADSEVETTEYLAVPRDLFGPLDLTDPLEDLTSPALEVFDAFDLAPTWIEALRDQDESEAA